MKCIWKDSEESRYNSLFYTGNFFYDLQENCD